MSPSIVRAAIHPTIGVARIGDSPDAFFIGPEDPTNQPDPTEDFRDAEGYLKRQAARFRVALDLWRGHARRLVVRSTPRRSNVLDGGALADRHGQLPRRLRSKLRCVCANLLAGTGSQPVARRKQLRPSYGSKPTR